MNICAHTMSELPESGCRERGQHEECAWCAQPATELALDEEAAGPTHKPQGIPEGSEWGRPKGGQGASEAAIKAWKRRKAKSATRSTARPGCITPEDLKEAREQCTSAAAESHAKLVDQVIGCEGHYGPAVGGMAAEPAPTHESPLMGADPAEVLPTEDDLNLLDARAERGSETPPLEIALVNGSSISGFPCGPDFVTGIAESAPVFVDYRCPDCGGDGCESCHGGGCQGETLSPEPNAEAGDHIEGYVLRAAVSFLRSTVRGLRERGLVRAALPLLLNEYNSRPGLDPMLRLVDTTELRALAGEAGFRINTLRGIEGVILEEPA